MITEQADIITDKFISIFNNIDKGKGTLTKDEKFACCLSAGAEIESVLRDRMLHVKTKNECGVVMVEGKIFVAENVSGGLRKVYL